MRGNRGLIIALLLAIILVAGVRLFGLSLLTVSGNGQAPTLQAGDRVLVGRWAYGYRVPLTQYFGYHRWKVQRVVPGDWVAYNSPLADSAQALPDTSTLCIGRCLASPGDTVWVGSHLSVSPYRNYGSGQIWPLVVPAKGIYVRITPWNVALYARTINAHESGHATIQGDSLCISGRRVGYYRFQHDYYWMQSGNPSNLCDSRTLGFVPHAYVYGRARTIFYSVDSTQPWYRRWLWRRMFLPL